MKYGNHNWIWLTTGQQEGGPMERHHCRILHWWCARCPWRSKSCTKRCDRLCHPARGHRGCRYWIPENDGREHEVRHTANATTSFASRGQGCCSYIMGGLRQWMSGGFCIEMENKRAFGGEQQEVFASFDSRYLLTLGKSCESGFWCSGKRHDQFCCVIYTIF